MSYSIGTTYEGKNFNYLNDILPFIDHIEVSPDSIAAKKGGNIHIDQTSLQHFKWAQSTKNVSVLLHGVGLSIGSYDGYSKEYIALLDKLFNALNIRWHSEHLAYTKVNGENIGTMLTLPRTDEVIDMICARVDEIQTKYKKPFLLENVISMLPAYQCKYSDAEFLNRITQLTGCGLVLDVYNMECDAVNFGFNTNTFLQEININSVVEMHVAGGLYDPEFNFQMDIHLGMVADSTIELTNKILLQKPPNLKAITFEILKEFIDQFGSTGIIAELKKLRKIFNHHEPTITTNQSLCTY